MNGSFDRRQLLALCFVASLAPITRLIPRANTLLAGRPSWLSPLAAIPFLLLYMLYLGTFLSQRREGEGMAELILRGFGGVLGKAVLVILALYFLLYCGFLLRSGADRYVSAIYTAGKPWPFVGVMLALGTVVALGPKKALLRLARIAAPFIGAVLVIILLFSLTDADASRLLPVTVAELPAVLSGSIPAVDIAATVPVFAAFLMSGCEKRRGERRALVLWGVFLCLAMSAITAAIVGTCGAELTAQLSHPFFVMVRNVKLFGSIERIEAVIVSLWLFSDLALLAMLQLAAQRCLLLVCGFVTDDGPAKALDMKNGRWLVPAGSLVILGTAIALGSSEALLDLISLSVVPVINLVISLALLSLCCICVRVRA